MTALCPHCGRALTITLSRASTPPARSWSAMGRLESSISTPWGGPSTDPARPDFSGDYERIEPVRAATVESDFKVILLQSLASGAFVGLAAGAACYALHWPAMSAIIGGFVTAAAVWFGSLSDTRSLLRRVERITNTDLDGDQAIGDPQPQAVQKHEYTVKTQKADGSAEWRMILDTKATPEVMREFARRCLAGQTSTHAMGNLLDRKELEGLRDRLISAGFATWRGNGRARGWELSAKGRALMSGIADSAT